MMLLGALSLAATCAITGVWGVKNGIKKNTPSRLLSNGDRVSYDLRGREYVNGERVKTITKKSPSGREYKTTVGVHSGKEYYSVMDEITRRKLFQSTLERNSARENGIIVYPFYCVECDRWLIKETETDKIIVGIERRTIDNEDELPEYRKFYVSDAVDLYHNSPSIWGCSSRENIVQSSREEFFEMEKWIEFYRKSLFKDDVLQCYVTPKKYTNRLSLLAITLVEKDGTHLYYYFDGQILKSDFANEK